MEIKYFFGGITMEYHILSFYDEFACKADNCPDTCCIGWKIPLDLPSLASYQKEKGRLGLRLSFAIRKKDGVYAFNHKASKCPFLDCNQLCQLQREKGPEFIPRVCRRYPRTFLNFGSFTEVTLQLACPEVSRLFLQHYSDFSMTKRNFSMTDTLDRFGTNDDFHFLNQLAFSRDVLVHWLRDQGFSWEITSGMLVSYGRLAQNACIAGDFSFFDQTDLSLLFTEAPDDYAFSIDGKATDLLITSGLYHPKLSSRMPLLYKLCRRYFKTYDSMSAQEATLYFSTQKKKLWDTYPQYKLLFRSYFIYYVDCSFLLCFENYSFLRILTQGLIHTHLLMLFATLYLEEFGSLEESDMAKLISTYEKRARHNEDILSIMYDRIYPFLPTFSDSADTWPAK